MASASLCHLRYIMVHKDKVTETPAHDKKMEDLMGSKILMFGIKDRQFQCIDHTANGVDNASGQQPEKCTRCQGAYDWTECQDAGPSHADI